MDERLNPLLGEWRVTTSIGSTGTATLEPTLDGAFLQVRSVMEDPVPNSLSLIAPDGDAFRQHYFDARGVVRLYAMTFADGLWTLTRDSADFSPFDFAQRFVGEVSDDVIRGRWERDGEVDFELTYERVRG